MPKKVFTEYEKMTFEDAVRVIYYQFSGDAKTFRNAVAELLVNAEPAYKNIAPAWYEGYKNHIQSNE